MKCTVMLAIENDIQWSAEVTIANGQAQVILDAEGEPLPMRVELEHIAQELGEFLLRAYEQR